MLKLNLGAASLFALLATTTPASAEQLPYEARVVVPAAPIQSGPSDAFYPSDTLPEGATVEVYREEANGWCAIRPPENSFSWIYARHLRKLDNSLAEVNKDDVSSRIGSRLTEKRNAVQVRLKRGEVVQIVGGETVAGQTWYKIAPPAGEFRWIHSSSIQRTKPLAKSPAAASQVVTASATVDAADTSQVTTAVGEEPASAPSPFVESAPNDSESDWRASSDPAAGDRPAPPLATQEGATAANSATPSTEPAPATANSSATTPVETPDAPTSQAPLPPADLARQLADVELRLSRAVTGPPTSWNIDVLERDAEQLLARAQTPAERENVKVTLAKLDRFAAIERRYARIPANSITPIPPTGIGSPLASSVPTIPSAPLAPNRISPLPTGAAQSNTGATTVEGISYDAVGILRPVVSKRPGAPQFALVDERGQVLSFVTATPDVNLQPYIGRRVGVAGNRGFIPEFQRAHVTAGRVTPLTDRMVR